VHSVKLTASSAEGGPGGSPLEVEITGTDLGELRRIAADVVRVTKEVDGTSDVDQSYRTGQPEIRIVPDQEKAGRHNVTVSDLAMTVRTYVEGSEATQFRDRGEDYDIRIRLDQRYRNRAEDVHNMFVKSPVTGEMVPISEVASARYDAGPTVITRKDRRRLISISSQLTGEKPLKAVKDEVERRLDAELVVPEGVKVEFGGEVEMMVENFAEIFKAMAIAGVLTFLCVAGIIESFALAVIIIMAVPVCLIGVTVALLVSDVTMNMFSLMAMIMLVGMVVNNAIIVLDYATRPERSHLPPSDRIKEACEVRFRVMMMANLTTIVAMIPLSLGLGFAGEIFRPLAVVQIGGVFAAGTLSLIVIPVVYVMIEHLREGRDAPWRQGSGQ